MTEFALTRINSASSLVLLTKLIGLNAQLSLSIQLVGPQENNSDGALLLRIWVTTGGAMLGSISTVDDAVDDARFRQLTNTLG